MNAYEFIKKGYGTKDIQHLNLYILILSDGKEYQVKRIDNLEVLLTEFFEDGTSTGRFLSKQSNLKVVRLSVEDTRRLVKKSKTTLYLDRG